MSSKGILDDSPALDGSNDLRIVQTNEEAFIVQERVGVLGFRWWSTWRTYFIDSDWISHFPTEERAKDAIRRVLGCRRQQTNPKTFKRRIVWP
jgi:hypothetical protein